MNKKTLLCLLAVCAMLFSLCGGALAENAWADTVSAGEAEKQLELLFAELTALTQEESAGTLYTVTDLDRNGRLELIAVLTDGADGCIAAKIAEIGEVLDDTAVQELPAEGDAELPAILAAEARVFADAVTGEVHYLFDTTERNGAAVTAVRTGSLMLLNGKVSTGKVSSVNYSDQRGLIVMEFADSNGNMLSPDEYDKLPATLFRGAEEEKVNFQWFTAEECTSAEILKNSYAVFTGEQAAAEDAAALDEKASTAAAAAEAVTADDETAAVTTATGENIYASVEEAREALGLKEEPALQQSGETLVIKPASAEASQSQATAGGQQVYSSVEEAREALGIKENKQQNNSGVYIVETPQPQKPQPAPVPVPTKAPDPIIDDPSQSGKDAGSGSFSSDTGTALNIYASYQAVTLGSNLVQVTVSANLAHSTLTARANTLSFSLGGDYGSATAPEINCSGGSASTYLGSTTFTVPLAPGESKSLNCSVSWNFGGTYSGVSIAAVTANGTVWLSR